MNTEVRIALAMLGTILSIVIMLVGYNLYTNHESRILYKQCLDLTEKLIKEDRKSSVPFCRV